MTSALHNYHKINGVLPDRIIIYRDGVGDGQVSPYVTRVGGSLCNLSIYSHLALIECSYLVFVHLLEPHSITISDYEAYNVCYNKTWEIR